MVSFIAVILIGAALLCLPITRQPGAHVSMLHVALIHLLVRRQAA